jgi:hypothetical protein
MVEIRVFCIPDNFVRVHEYSAFNPELNGLYSVKNGEIQAETPPRKVTDYIYCNGD